MIEAGQQVAVIGAGVTGQSVARYVRNQGAHPVLLDTRAAPGAADDTGTVRWGVRHWPRDLSVDLAVVSPGLSLQSCLLTEARTAGVRLVSDIDVFFTAVDEPVLGITGTNGKSTVTSLAGHLLNHAAVATGVGGNLGQAALDIVAPEHQCYVLELSSFQLERSAEHPFHRATILNITEDHLDHHGDLAGYQRAKQKIYQAARGVVVSRAEPLCQPRYDHPEGHADDAPVVTYGLDEPPGASHWGIRQLEGQRWICMGEQTICPLSGLPLQGRHNEENMLAACALVHDLLLRHTTADQLAETFARGLRSFHGLPHRFELVAQHDNVQYINDSKATNLGATMAALQGMPAQDQVILIAGGDAKGVDLTPLAELLSGRVKLLLVIGAAADHLADVGKQAAVAVSRCDSLEEAVTGAIDDAVSGDCVLLSPACSSLDMFDSFARRGEIFSAAVKSRLGGA